MRAVSAGHCQNSALHGSRQDLRRHSVRNRNVGPGPTRQVPKIRASLRLGGNGMDRLKVRLPAVARPPWFELIELPVYQPLAFFWWWFRLRRRLAGLNFLKAPISPHQVATPLSPRLSRCRFDGRGRSTRSRRTGPRAGLQPMRSTAPACFTSIALCSADGAARIAAMTAPNMRCASRRREAADGVGLVMPRLVTWPGSVITQDIKGEIWTLAAVWRRGLGRVLWFDPTNADDDAYNPPLEVRLARLQVFWGQSCSVSMC